jgi:hypothetical protein
MNCHKEITSPRANQKFCRGARCRNAAWRANHPRRRRTVRAPRWSFESRVAFESLIGI